MNNKINNKGFTLPELLASLAIFSLVIGGASGIFISTIQAQRRVLASQELLDQTSYLMEYMSRALRMARKELNCTNPEDPSTCSCLTIKGYGYNYEIQEEGGMRFINYNGICQEFYLSGTKLKENKDGSISDLTSNALKVLSFNIGPADSWYQTDKKQPRVTLFLEIKGAGLKPEAQPEIKIQTTISQRALDVQY